MRSWQCLVFTCLVACGNDKSPKSQTELRKAHGDAIKAKLEAIKAAGAAGRGAADDASVTSVPGLDFDDLDNKVNALATMYDDTQDLASDAKAERFTGMKDFVRAAKELMGVTMADPLYQLDERQIAYFDTAKYVLVVYRSAFTKPQLSGDGSFSPGAVESANVLVELGTNKILGSFTSQAVSSTEVKAPNVDGHVGAERSYQEYLSSDLRKAWNKAVVDGIEKRWSGAQVPLNF